MKNLLSSVVRVATKLGSLVGVACLVAAGMAVATSSVASATAVWSDPTAQVGTPGGAGIFNGISCTGEGDCTAAGFDVNGQGMAATESAGVWSSVTEVPGPSGGYFHAVSCSSPGNCVAVGNGGVSGEPIVATESHGMWGSAVGLPGSPGGFGYFYGVSCTAQGNCTAVGGDGNFQGLVDSEVAGVWGTPTQLTSPPNGFFDAVSCTAQGSCTAVGADGAQHPIAATEAGGTWGTVAEVDSGGDSGAYDGVSCTDGGDCVAVGGDGNHQPIVANESGGSWGSPVELTGAQSGTGVLQSVSCPSADNCTAVGAASLTGGNEQPITAAESMGIWSGATVPGSGSEIGQFYGVSCTGVGICTAAGSNYSQPTTATSGQFAIATSTLPPASVGVPYGPVSLQAINAGVSSPPYVTSLKWGKVKGSGSSPGVPKGMKLSSSGVLSGTPNRHLTPMTYSVAVEVTESVTVVAGGSKSVAKETVEATIPLAIG